jgi:hypothetical protein
MLRFRVTPEEREMIEKKMEEYGTDNMAAYLRKMAIDGYVIRMELPEIGTLTGSWERSEAISIRSPGASTEWDTSGSKKSGLRGKRRKRSGAAAGRTPAC